MESIKTEEENSNGNIVNNFIPMSNHPSHNCWELPYVWAALQRFAPKIKDELLNGIFEYVPVYAVVKVIFNWFNFFTLF